MAANVPIFEEVSGVSLDFPEKENHELVPDEGFTVVSTGVDAGTADDMKSTNDKCYEVTKLKTKVAKKLCNGENMKKRETGKICETWCRRLLCFPIESI